MKSKYVLIAAAAMLALNGRAQVTSVDAEVDAELNQLYSGQAGAVTTQRAQPVQQAPVYQQAVQQAPQPVYQQPITQQSALMQIQKQPTTLIEASPLTESRADSLRKGRQEEEVRTEARIVEKLESSRLEDEKRRASILFGDKFDSLQNHQQAAPLAPAVQPAPLLQQPQQAAPVAPAPQPIIIQQEAKEDTRDVVREEIRAALDAENNAVTSPVEVRYFGGFVGITEYPDVKNIKSNYSLGAAFGTKYDQLIVEGSFLYSNFTADINNYYRYSVDNYDINQYTGAMTAKYQMFAGIIRPVLGGTIAYSYRKFTLTNSRNGVSEDTGNSHAVDLGVVTGADLEFSPKVSIGLDFRYLFNLSSRVNANYANSTYGYVGTPVEKLSYYVMGIVGRVNF